MIEPAAAGLAATRGTEQDHAAIVDAYVEMTASANDVSAFARADVAFHIVCLRAARNDFLLPVTHAIRASLATWMVTNSDPELNMLVTLAQHKRVLDAILARDAGTAQAAMTAHLTEADRYQATAARHALAVQGASLRLPATPAADRLLS
jgi:DNA-binding FadR family transcriptional regulator